MNKKSVIFDAKVSVGFFYPEALLAFLVLFLTVFLNGWIKSTQDLILILASIAVLYLPGIGFTRLKKKCLRRIELGEKNISFLSVSGKEIKRLKLTDILQAHLSGSRLTLVFKEEGSSDKIILSSDRLGLNSEIPWVFTTAELKRVKELAEFVPSA